MPISARIIADSVSPAGIRLVTFELTYPRFIHSELMTHRAFSRNASSSRAIPIETMLKRIEENPAGPIFWAANQKGMQAVEEVSDVAGTMVVDRDGSPEVVPTYSPREFAKGIWAEACRDAIRHSRSLSKLGVHKAIANRLTEPFQHMVTLVSATDWANFFHLRYHPAAQQEFQALAKLMYQLFHTHTPTILYPGEWHMPYIKDEDRKECARLVQEDDSIHDEDRRGEAVVLLRKVSTGRCARTSYVNQNGIRDLKDDIGLHDRLVASPDSGDPGHWSPFEHVASAQKTPHRSGNFFGWTQYRKLFTNENTTQMPQLPLE